MELLVKGKNMEVPEPVRRYAQRKIGRLSRYLHNITEGEVELTRENTRSSGARHVAQVTLVSRGTILRCEERAGDPYAAIDAVAAAMNRRIERYKGKLYGRGRATLPEKAAPILEAEAEEESPQVVRVKRFPVKPMTEEEAVEQMELLGHDFFIFLNASTHHLCVLYRRRDGDYGLIEPDLT